MSRTISRQIAPMSGCSARTQLFIAECLIKSLAGGNVFDDKCVARTDVFNADMRLQP